jgi:hypothetical protein
MPFASKEKTFGMNQENPFPSTTTRSEIQSGNSIIFFILADVSAPMIIAVPFFMIK